jgi:hypothetical protein
VKSALMARMVVLVLGCSPQSARQPNLRGCMRRAARQHRTSAGPQVQVAARQRGMGTASAGRSYCTQASLGACGCAPGLPATDLIPAATTKGYYNVLHNTS